MESSHSHFLSQWWHIRLPLAWFFRANDVGSCEIGWIEGVNSVCYTRLLHFTFIWTYSVLSHRWFFFVIISKKCHCSRTQFLSVNVGVCVCVALSSSTIRFLFKIRIEHTQFFGAFDLDETLLLIKANTCSMEHLCFPISLSFWIRKHKRRALYLNLHVDWIVSSCS